MISCQPWPERDHLGEECRQRCRDRIAVDRKVDDTRAEQPGDENREQEETDRRDRRNGRRMAHVERMFPRHVEPSLAPPADFIKADRREGTDQRETGHQRKQQRQGVVAGCPGGKENTDERVDDGNEHDVRRLRHEIVEPESQRVDQVGEADLANIGMDDPVVGACDDMKTGHDRYSCGVGSVAPRWAVRSGSLGHHGRDL